MLSGLQTPKKPRAVLLMLQESVCVRRWEGTALSAGGERPPLLVLLGVSGILLRGTSAEVTVGAAHFLTKMVYFYCENAAFSGCGSV